MRVLPQPPTRSHSRTPKPRGIASPSSIQNLISLLGEEKDVLARVPAICAGPVTAQAAHEAGLIVAVVSADPGAAAMADALARHWVREPGLGSLRDRLR